MRIQTEIGLLGNTFTGLSGKTKVDFGHGDAQYITFLNVLTHPTIDPTIFERVNVKPNEKQNLCKKGDLFFNTSSETPEEVGMCSCLNVNVPRLYLNSFCFGFRLKEDASADSQYLAYFFRGKEGRQIMTMLAQGATRYNLSKENFMRTSIELPPKPEQERIAAALTSIDSLIENLERTIQKKKHIREGAMEELLSGKRRLPGFSGEWVEKKFEELYKFAKEGGTPSTSNPEFYNNASIPFAKIEDLNNHYLTKTENFINQNGIDHSSAWLVPTGSLLLSNGATLGEVTITAVPLATKQGILGVIVREQFSVEFLYYLLKTKDFKRKMEAITTHGTMDCAYLKDLKGIELYLPSDIREQHAIADTLTALDDEVALLQAERDKYLQIRSGMMDDLLTGKIRLQ